MKKSEWSHSIAVIIYCAIKQVPVNTAVAKLFSDCIDILRQFVPDNRCLFLINRLERITTRTPEDRRLVNLLIITQLCLYVPFSTYNRFIVICPTVSVQIAHFVIRKINHCFCGDNYVLSSSLTSESLFLLARILVFPLMGFFPPERFSLASAVQYSGVIKELKTFLAEKLYHPQSWRTPPLDQKHQTF